MHSGPQSDLSFYQDEAEYWRAKAKEEQTAKSQALWEVGQLRQKVRDLEAELNDYAMPFRS